MPLSEYQPTPNVVIEPAEPLVMEAVREIRKMEPNFFSQVEKIVVHSGGGVGHFGYVARGPNLNPREIHIFKDKIRQHIENSYDGDINDRNFKNAVILAIIEVIAHEKTHIGDNPENIFLGEPEAQSGGQEMAKKIQPTLLAAQKELNLVQYKYSLPIKNYKPTVELIANVINDNKVGIFKEAKNIIFNNKKTNLNDIVKYNNDNAYRTIKFSMPLASSCGINAFDENYVFQLAAFQNRIGIPVTGTLNKETIKKLSEFRFDKFPNNFGVVIPGLLYRGSLILNINQLQHLKEQCNIERVVALHKEDSVKDMCKLLNIEYFPAYLENGSKDEEGMLAFKDGVFKVLLEKPTYVFCYHGKDRAGAVVAKLRTEAGWSPKNAILEAKSFGMGEKYPKLIEWISKEQNAFDPSPSDMPIGDRFYTPTKPYMTYMDYYTDMNPYMGFNPDSTGIYGPTGSVF